MRKNKVLLAGAGLGGRYALSEFQHDPSTNIEVVGFVDDAKHLVGTSIEGVKVLGPIANIPSIVTELKVDQVIIAMPSVTGEPIRRIQGICANIGVECKVISGVYDLITGRSAPSTLREVRFEDFVKRRPADIDLNAVRGYLKDSCVLITGAGGSIGSEIVRQLAYLKPKRILLLDRAENSLTEVLWDLRINNMGDNVRLIIADLNDESKLQRIFMEEKPDVVFHAAAFKHVYLMEMYPEEAVRNNIIGSDNLIRVAINSGVKKLIAISTDKAVNPTSVMGVSKRVMELLVKEYARRNPDIILCAVRFGNVFNSDGSVIRLFRKQINSNAPITITDPKARRFFMSVSEAAQLVIQSGAFDNSGVVFMLDMGESINIMEIAREMCRLNGHILEKTIPVIYTGLGEGEKLDEELVMNKEKSETTTNERVMQLIDQTQPWNSMEQDVLTLEKLALECNKEDILHELERIVPEFRRKVK